MHQLNKNFVNLNNCRLCLSYNLKKFISFSSVQIGNNLPISAALSKKVKKYELRVMRCSNCNHFQLSIAVSPIILYATNYTYLSGVGHSFVKHLKNYVCWVQKKTKLNLEAVVVDIGSNDGTCLKYFKERGFKVCGVDPAKKPSDIANNSGIFTINNFFNSEVVNQIIKKFGKVDLVTSQNVLAHVDNLRDTFENIFKILKVGGFFVFEIGYFKKVLENKYFDTIYHEHIDYHHANPLAKFLVSLGFDFIHISENDVQGGSIRLLFKKTKNGVIRRQPQKFLKSEKESILYDEIKLKSWPTDIKTNMNKLYNLFKKNHYNKNCYAYGAPTKASLLFKTSNLNENDISFIVEDNELKVGRFLPTTSIPIISIASVDFEKEALIIIFAWNFADDIIKKLKKKYKVPASIIIPLPEPKVIII